MREGLQQRLQRRQNPNESFTDRKCYRVYLYTKHTHTHTAYNQYTFVRESQGDDVDGLCLTRLHGVG